MYSFERFMKVLKGYVQNHNFREGCFVECHVTKEALEFCIEYLWGIDAIRILNVGNDDCKGGKPLVGACVATFDHKLLLQLHHYVLENTTITQPYIE